MLKRPSYVHELTSHASSVRGELGVCCRESCMKGCSTIWVQRDSRGSQGNAWHGADVSIGTPGIQTLQFVYTSGEDAFGDFALDYIEWEVVSRPSPRRRHS